MTARPEGFAVFGDFLRHTGRLVASGRSALTLTGALGCAVLSSTLCIAPTPVHGQGVTTPADSVMARDGLYDRPFIGSVSSTSIGGYVEGNTNYFVEDGVTEGFSMELRRFNIFLFSQLSPRIRFISELEFEHGTEEIALETALVDVTISQSLVLRGGIILPPIGFLNQNHDSPRWDFVERPIVTTGIIPSTLSEVGFGVHGRVASRSLLVSYEAYLTNGLGDGILGNDTGRTDLPSGKREEAFGSDNNGSPAVSGRLGFRHPGRGEVGVSYYGGHYNSYRIEGVTVDEARWVGITALDLGARIGTADVRAEVAIATIDVPEGLVELSGSRQWGGHVDVLLPIWRPRIDGYAGAVVTAGVRVEYVDYNVGTFSSTGRPIRDDVTAIVPGFTFRPSPGAVFRVNYRYHWTRDFPGNPASRTAGIQFGFATYF